MADKNVQIKFNNGGTQDNIFPVTKLPLVEGLPEALDTVNAQLADNADNLQTRSINVMYPPVPYVGAKADGSDETVIINNLINAVGFGVVEFPEGTYRANVSIPRYGITLVGKGKEKTTIKGVDVLKPVMDTNDYNYLNIKGMTLTQLAASEAAVLKATDSRYMTLEDIRTQQEADSGGSQTYKADGIDMRNINKSWVGYNTLKEVHSARCKNGVVTGPDLHSALSISNCAFSFNGYFGMKLDGVEVGFLSNIDCAANGQLGSGNEAMYGGTYIKGSQVSIHNVWGEYNANKFSFFSPNNIYIHPDSFGISFPGDRGARGNSGSRFFAAASFSQANGISDYAPNDGMGKERINNFILNGSYKHWIDSSIPSEWTTQTTGSMVLTKETASLPLGYESGLHYKASGASNLIQYIYSSDHVPGAIKNISLYAGKYLTITFWIKRIAAGTIRVGFDTGSAYGVYFSTGQYETAFPTGEFVKVVLTKKIVGTEYRIAAGMYAEGTAEFIVTGFAVALSPRINDDEGHYITEEGGSIYGMMKFGGKRHYYGYTAPTTPPPDGYTWQKGDIVYNLNASAGGYIGWMCNVAGTTGAWNGFGAIQA